jgi:hypothetical protein
LPMAIPRPTSPESMDVDLRGAILPDAHHNYFVGRFGDVRRPHSWPRDDEEGRVRDPDPMGIPIDGRYRIHDNGNDSFIVDVVGPVVTVWVMKEVSSSDEVEVGAKYLDVEDGQKQVVVGSFTFTSKTGRVFVGDDTTHDVEFARGNSILVEEDAGTYVFIGRRISRFTTDDTAVAYYSHIGNSDVTYPVLLGTEYVYFLENSVGARLPRSMFPTDYTEHEWAENAFQHYSGNETPNLEVHVAAVETTMTFTPPSDV